MFDMSKQQVIFRDLGTMDYKTAWDYQEELLQHNVRKKSAARSLISPTLHEFPAAGVEPDLDIPASDPDTQHYLLFVEHTPVYTLGKSGRCGEQDQYRSQIR